jgi:hypothetical protein
LQVKSKKLSKNNLVDTLIFYFKSFHLLHYIERKIFFELSLRLFFLQKKRITAIKRFRLASPTQIARLKPRNFDYLQNVNLKISSQRRKIEFHVFTITNLYLITFRQVGLLLIKILRNCQIRNGSGRDTSGRFWLAFKGLQSAKIENGGHK